MPPKSDSPFTLATWNVNSIRARLPRVTSWLERHQPDVLCMQETKVEDEGFPHASFTKLGYAVVAHGEKGRNGVAIASRLPMTEQRCGWATTSADESKRIASARIAGIDVITVYVPNGQSVGSEAYFEKIEWLVRLRQHLATCYDPKKPLVICGDWNVAPGDDDVYDPRLTGGLHCTKAERDALAGVMAFGLTDVQRHLSKEPAFTWWSYTPSDWKKDRGMRIDLTCVTAPLLARVESITVDREERGADKGKDKPSDHAPVVTRFSS